MKITPPRSRPLPTRETRSAFSPARTRSNRLSRLVRTSGSWNTASSAGEFASKGVGSRRRRAKACINRCAEPRRVRSQSWLARAARLFAGYCVRERQQPEQRQQGREPDVEPQQHAAAEEEARESRRQAEQLLARHAAEPRIAEKGVRRILAHQPARLARAGVGQPAGDRHHPPHAELEIGAAQPNGPATHPVAQRRRQREQGTPPPTVSARNARLRGSHRHAPGDLDRVVARQRVNAQIDDAHRCELGQDVGRPPRRRCRAVASARKPRGRTGSTHRAGVAAGSLEMLAGLARAWAAGRPSLVSLSTSFSDRGDRKPGRCRTSSS